MSEIQSIIVLIEILNDNKLIKLILIMMNVL